MRARGANESDLFTESSSLALHINDYESNSGGDEAYESDDYNYDNDYDFYETDEKAANDKNITDYEYEYDDDYDYDYFVRTTTPTKPDSSDDYNDDEDYSDKNLNLSCDKGNSQNNLINSIDEYQPKDSFVFDENEIGSFQIDNQNSKKIINKIKSLSQFEVLDKIDPSVKLDQNSNISLKKLNPETNDKTNNSSNLSLVLDDNFNSSQIINNKSMKQNREMDEKSTNKIQTEQSNQTRPLVIDKKILNQDNNSNIINKINENHLVMNNDHSLLEESQSCNTQLIPTKNTEMKENEQIKSVDEYYSYSDSNPLIEDTSNQPIIQNSNEHTNTNENQQSSNKPDKNNNISQSFQKASEQIAIKKNHQINENENEYSYSNDYSSEEESIVISQNKTSNEKNQEILTHTESKENNDPKDNRNEQIKQIQHDENDYSYSDHSFDENDKNKIQIQNATEQIKSNEQPMNQKDNEDEYYSDSNSLNESNPIQNSSYHYQKGEHQIKNNKNHHNSHAQTNSQSVSALNHQIKINEKCHRSNNKNEYSQSDYSLSENSPIIKSSIINSNVEAKVLKSDQKYLSESRKKNMHQLTQEHANNSNNVQNLVETITLFPKNGGSVSMQTSAFVSGTSNNNEKLLTDNNLIKKPKDSLNAEANINQIPFENAAQNSNIERNQDLHIIAKENQSIKTINAETQNNVRAASLKSKQNAFEKENDINFRKKQQSNIKDKDVNKDEKAPIQSKLKENIDTYETTSDLKMDKTPNAHTNQNTRRRRRRRTQLINQAFSKNELEETNTLNFSSSMPNTLNNSEEMITTDNQNFTQNQQTRKRRRKHRKIENCQESPLTQENLSNQLMEKPTELDNKLPTETIIQNPIKKRRGRIKHSTSNTDSYENSNQVHEDVNNDIEKVEKRSSIKFKSPRRRRTFDGVISISTQTNQSNLVQNFHSDNTHEDSIFQENGKFYKTHLPISKNRFHHSLSNTDHSSETYSNSNEPAHLEFSNRVHDNISVASSSKVNDDLLDSSSNERSQYQNGYSHSENGKPPSKINSQTKRRKTNQYIQREQRHTDEEKHQYPKRTIKKRETDEGSMTNKSFFKKLNSIPNSISRNRCIEERRIDKSLKIYSLNPQDAEVGAEKAKEEYLQMVSQIDFLKKQPNLILASGNVNQNPKLGNKK